MSVETVVATRSPPVFSPVARPPPFPGGRFPPPQRSLTPPPPHHLTTDPKTPPRYKTLTTRRSPTPHPPPPRHCTTLRRGTASSTPPVHGQRSLAVDVLLFGAGAFSVARKTETTITAQQPKQRRDAYLPADTVLVTKSYRKKKINKKYNTTALSNLCLFGNTA